MNDKVSQKDVDAAADKFLKEHGYDIEKVVPNQVATKSFGMTRANQAFNNAFKDWKERRINEGVPYIYKAPPELDAAFEIAFESFCRVTKGLVGKYRAQDAEAHEQDANKWSERYDELEARYHELRRKLDDAESARVSMVEENARLGAELAQTHSALGMTEAALNEAREFGNRLFANLGRGSDPDAGPGPVPSAGDVQAQTETGANTPAPARRGPGRPRNNPNSSKSGASSKHQAEDLLPGHAWEQTSVADDKDEV